MDSAATNRLQVDSPSGHINPNYLIDDPEDLAASRFRVDRVNSVAVGCHRQTPPKEQPSILKPSELNSSLPDYLESIDQIGEPRQLQVIKPKMPQRRVSIAEGVVSTGLRRKSSNLPGLEEFHEGGTGNSASLTVGLYGKSLYRYTQDALPKLENYRNLMSLQAAQRPTMDELMDEDGGGYRVSMQHKITVSERFVDHII